MAWQWKATVIALVLATIVTAGHEGLGLTWLMLPSLPVVVVGAALGIFVSFRTNSAYDRWWEGRKLWGQLINSSRYLGIQCMQYIPASQHEARRELIRRHISYVHSLRCALRGEDPLQDEAVLRSLSEVDKTKSQGTSNLPMFLLGEQLACVVRVQAAEGLDSFRLQSLDETLRALLDTQGGCERIYKTPLPKIYGFMCERLVLFFGGLLPCALVSTLSWGAIPVSTMVVLAFKFISETGRVLENPFTTFWNGLPMSSMSTMIEINMLELLGEGERPEPVQENPPGILM